MKRIFSVLQLLLVIISLLILPNISNANTLNITEQSSGTTANLSSISFYDANHGFIAGANGTIKKTTNGGTNWTVVTHNYPESHTPYIYSYSSNLTFLSNYYDGYIEISTDNGSNWILRYIFEDKILYRLRMFSDYIGFTFDNDGYYYMYEGYDYQVSSSLYSLDATSPNNGVFVGNNGKIINVDAETSTVLDKTYGTANYKTVKVVDDNLWWIAGENGVVIRTTDAGTSWTTCTAPASETLTACWFFDANEGVVAGTNKLYYTQNGGTSWTTVNLLSNSVISEINFPTATTGYAAGSGGKVYKLGIEIGTSAPTTQASAINFTNVSITSFTINWTNGDGAKRAVFVKEGTGAITNPSDNTTYTTSTDWNLKGTQLGEAGYYCVYNGTDATVSLTNLAPCTTYTVQVFEYNGEAGSEVYLTTTATNNPNNQITQKIVYVDASKSDDSGNGFSWATAKKTLQAALDLAISGIQIWVKAGTYKPTSSNGLGGGSEYYHFRMKNGVAIYGGFAGDEASDYDLNLRDFTTNETILSGDIGLEGENSDNCYHVFFNIPSLGLDSTAILDGFTITKGYAHDNNPHDKGAGIFNSYCSPTLNNLILTNNSSSDYGGAIKNTDSSSPILTNVILTDNTALAGGGMDTDNGSPVLINVLIKNNSSTYGGGFSASSSNSTLTNVTIVNNTASTSGGGIEFNGGTLTMNNSIIWGNTASYGEQINKSSETVTLNYSCYSNGFKDIYGTITTNNCITDNPLFVNASGGDFRIQGVSPCADAGDNSYNTLTEDIRGGTFGRKLDKTSGATGTIDMGCYEYKYGSDQYSIYPITQADSITFSSIAGNQFTINWINGDGDSRAVFVHKGSSGTAAPVDNTTYTADTVYNFGSDIGSSEWYCVFNGTGSGPVTVTGLLQHTTYRVMVCEYKGTAGSEKYLTTTAINNPNSQVTGPFYFSNNSGEYFGTWAAALTGTDDNGTITLLENFENDDNQSITNNLTLDLNAHIFSGTGINTIANSKTFILTNGTGTGTFDANVYFGGTSSAFQLNKPNILGMNFSTYDSPNSGLLILGDGTNSETFLIDKSDSIFDKVSKIIVNTNSTMKYGE